MLRLIVPCIIWSLAFNTLASPPLNDAADSLQRKSAPSPEILIVDKVLKTLKNKLPLEDDTKKQNNGVLHGNFFLLEEDESPWNVSSFSSWPRTLVKRQAPRKDEKCGQFPCPSTSSSCPFPPCYPLPPPPNLPPGPYLPPVLPYVPPRPPYQRPSYRPPPTYIPPPAPSRPTYAPPPTYIPPRNRPATNRPSAYRPRPRPHPTYRPRPRPSYPPRPRPTYRPRPRPLPPTPKPVCPPVNPNLTNEWDNLKIVISQAQQCNSQICPNKCGRRRAEKCAIDYETLLMRLALLEEKLRGLATLESRLKIHAALLLSIQKNPKFPGEHGARGSPGRKGLQGLKGPTGSPGVKGGCLTNSVTNPPAGPPGPPGNKGDPGHPGDKICNCNGVKGDEGPPGENVKGPPGPPGYKGVKGQRGQHRNYRNRK